jgi:6-phosphofructokinase 1
LYAHFKQAYCRRITASDVKAGTYMVVVAEGLKDASGSELYDESAGVDSFGHKKLAGSGKYVAQEIQKRLKADAGMTAFMKREGLLVQGLNDLPEVRTITPSHLVRSGSSSAYDVNFGMQAGAGAVELLVKGIAGVTVVDYKDGKVTYLPTKEAIRQRHVSLGDVALYEQLGITFGRPTAAVRPSLLESAPIVERLY